MPENTQAIVALRKARMEKMDRSSGEGKKQGLEQRLEALEARVEALEKDEEEDT